MAISKWVYPARESEVRRQKSVANKGPAASRSTTLMGNTILMAAEMIKNPLLESASEILGLPVEQLIARNRLIYDRDNPDHCIELKGAAKRSMMLRTLWGKGNRRDAQYPGGSGHYECDCKCNWGKNL